MHRRNERGAMVGVEAAVVLPALLLLVGLLVVLATMVLADQAVSGAAAQAARAASSERDVGRAVASAKDVASLTLAESGVDCLDTSVAVDAGGLKAPVGTPSKVTVTVTCRATFGVSFPGFPQSRVVEAVASSPVDTYRTR